MMELIHSFGAGIAFAVGVTVGAVLCRIATVEGRKEIVEDWKQHQSKVEERLSMCVMAQKSMADSLAFLASKERERGNEKGE